MDISWLCAQDQIACEGEACIGMGALEHPKVLESVRGRKPVRQVVWECAFAVGFWKFGYGQTQEKL